MDGKVVRRVLAGPLVALVLMCVMVAGVAAQTATPAAVAGSSTFSGKVTKTNPLTVNSNGQDRAVNPGANVAIVKDGKAATLADLKNGDQVNVTANPDGTASRIETTTAPASNGFLKWLIPLLVALLLIGLLVALLGRRRSNFVLERDRTNTPNTPRP